MEGNVGAFPAGIINMVMHKSSQVEFFFHPLFLIDSQKNLAERMKYIKIHAELVPGIIRLKLY